MTLKYFTYNEFDSPDSWGSGEVMMDDTFLLNLDKCREFAGIPFDITSGYRSPHHNQEIGGAEDSAHLGGYAADIACENSVDRGRIIRAAVQCGFVRIGIAHTFIHLDMDPNKPACMWVY